LMGRIEAAGDLVRLAGTRMARLDPRSAPWEV
jgi:hypothetical protein